MKIDITSDYHLHSHFSDGRVSIREMAEAAIDKGLKKITVTDHMPLPFETRYAMVRPDIDEYRSEIQAAQQEYQGKIRICAGLEIEYIPHLHSWIQSLAKMDWDTLITSVHGLYFQDNRGMVNGTLDEFERLLNLFDNDIKHLCTHYYQTLQKAYQTGLFDIAGHLDVIKKNNVHNRYFDESAPWYRDLVTQTLDVIKANGMKMEINTAGILHPIRQPYPGYWVIDQALEKNIPVVFGSDSHGPETLGQYFSDILAEIESTNPSMKSR